MGRNIDCAVWNQNKHLLAEKTVPMSAPTLKISLTADVLESPKVQKEIKDFIERINKDPVYSNQSKFMLKLGYCCGGQYQGKKIACKSAQGYVDIQEKIAKWLRNEAILGYIPYCLLQPLIRDNTEAKVVLFNGKFICRNPHKDGTGGRRSSLGSDDKALGAIAEEMAARFKASHPQLIDDQILRVDFFQDSTSGQYILNEVESFNAQVVGLGGGDSAGSVMDLVRIYWRDKAIQLAQYHVANNQ
jgi:hypothetical protein